MQLDLGEEAKRRRVHHECTLKALNCNGCLLNEWPVMRTGRAVRGAEERHARPSYGTVTETLVCACSVGSPLVAGASEAETV